MNVVNMYLNILVLHVASQNFYKVTILKSPISKVVIKSNYDIFISGRNRRLEIIYI
jgi:hypothetical protein